MNDIQKRSSMFTFNCVDIEIVVAVHALNALKKVRMYGLISTYLDIYMNVSVNHYMQRKGSNINIVYLILVCLYLVMKLESSNDYTLHYTKKFC